MDGILRGHFEQTAARASLLPEVLAVHDTTIFKFDGQREGLGPAHGGRGFYTHFTLLVAPDEARTPLGAIAVQKWTRAEAAEKTTKKKQQKSGQSFEAARWKKGVELAEERVNSRCSLVHVMDREGDSYDLWSHLMAENQRFVIRNSRNRLLEDGSSLIDAVARAEVVVEREVTLSRRAEQKIPDKRKQAQSRAGRLARLALGGKTVTVSRPAQCLESLPETLTINVVHVLEIGTNGEQDPVEWMLATTEPIGTAAEIERIVDIYRARWTIEEYFKVLKTSCDYEQRQLGSEHTLTNALGLFVPIAWQLLLLRALSRSDETIPAERALTPIQLEVLVAQSNGKLPRTPTVRQALLAIAALGGHIKNNGEPGWLVLYRGMRYLRILVEGWKIAKRCDQSLADSGH